MVEVKVVERYYPYNEPKVNDVFKEALFLSKGKTNNPIAYEASQTGMPAELIVEYFSNTTYDGTREEKVINTRRKSKRFGTHKEDYNKGIQCAKRVPDFRDTVLGRRFIEKVGEDNAFKMFEIADKNKHKVIPATYDAYVNAQRIVSGCHSYTVQDGFCDSVLYYNSIVEILPQAFEDVSKAELDTLAEKGIDLDKLTSVISNHSSINNAAYKKDFPKFFGYDIASYAHMPQEICSEYGNQEPFSTRWYNTLGSASYTYGTETNHRYNALYAQFMYKAMEEMGVGLVSTSQYFRNTVGAYNKITKKVISVNEKYQKMIKSKRNSIEPAVIRETIVGMFNEYADSAGLRFKMFIRDDKAAPTLEQAKPQKTTAKKSTKKASTKTKSVEKEATLVVNGVEIKCTKIERSR